jgi:hypothetical protein
LASGEASSPIFGNGLHGYISLSKSPSAFHDLSTMTSSEHPEFQLHLVQGQAVAPWLDALGGLRIAVFSEFPYLYAFWQGLGYQPDPALQCTLPWKTIGTSDKTQHTLTFWTKAFR